MNFLRVLVACLLAINLPLTAAVYSQAATFQVNRTDATAATPRSALLAADCKETTVMPASLPPRPTLRRATFAAKPVHRHHASAVHKPHKRAIKRHVGRRHHATKHHPRHRRHPAPHRARRAPLRLHRVTYASPLCDQRSSAMNSILGLPDYEITQPPEAATAAAIEDAMFDVPPVLGYTGNGGTGGPGPIFPGGPIFWTGPGPVIVIPVGPVGPVPPVGPVIPPIPPAAVPEPASWAMMMIGMALVGGSMRGRQRRTREKA
jgi:hypothetical protein